MVAAAKAELPELPDGQRAALELVADSVADRYAWRPRSPSARWRRTPARCEKRSTSSSMLARVRRLRSRTSASVPWSSSSSKRSTVSWS